MLKRAAVLVLLVLIPAGTVGCEAGAHSARGFRLPDGDSARGKLAFVELKCNTCHEVSGMDFPKPTIQPPVPVVLGGEVRTAMTDGYLATAIINPSHTIARGPVNQLVVNGKSRMPDYTQITVQQLNDLVAFLQAHYVVYVPTR